MYIFKGFAAFFADFVKLFSCFPHFFAKKRTGMHLYISALNTPFSYLNDIDRLSGMGDIHFSERILFAKEKVCRNSTRIGAI